MLVWFHTTPRGGGVPSGVDQLRALGEPVGVGAGLDDGAAEGESVDDGDAEPRVGEGLVQRRRTRWTRSRRTLSPRARSGPERAARRRGGPAACTRVRRCTADPPARSARWDLPVPESPIKHSGWPFWTHSPLARVWTTAGSMLGLALKSKPRRDFSRGTWRPGSGARIDGMLGRHTRPAVRRGILGRTSARSLLLILSPACGECVDTGSLPSVLVTAASWDRA
jgi:hypothetical protein